MKKLILILALVLSCVQYTDAQKSIYDIDFNYEHCKEYVREGDAYYASGNYKSAVEYYERAQRCNDDAKTKYITDGELAHKLEKARYALRYGASREDERHDQKNRMTDAIIGAIAGSGSSSNSNSGYSSNNSGYSSNNSSTTISSDNEIIKQSYNGVNYQISRRQSQYLKVTKVECYSDKTVIHFEFTNVLNFPNVWLNQNVYMKDRATNRKYNLISSTGLYPGQSVKVDSGESIDFSLTFPAVPETSAEVDVIEPTETGWKFYHIQLP